MNDIILNRKTLNGLGSRINDNAKGSDISLFARKQMEKMGWKEGHGLGKSESGIVSHIKAKKLVDNEGIGAKEARIENDNSDSTWWHDGFANALQNIKKKRKRSKKDKETNASSGIDYDALFKATGGARLGMRARADQSGKFKRAETVLSLSSSNDVESGVTDNMTVTESDSEPQAKKTKKSDKKKKDKKEKKSKKSKKAKVKN